MKLISALAIGTLSVLAGCALINDLWEFQATHPWRAVGVIALILIPIINWVRKATK